MIPPEPGPPIDPVAAALWQQRRVMVSGTLDSAAAMDLSSKLMALDGQSSDDIDLLINSRGGPMADVGAALDVLAMMRAKVNATCLGGAEGTAAMVLACATGTRRAAPHARISLRTDDRQTIAGSYADIETEASSRAAMRSRLAQTVATATGQQPDKITTAFDRGHTMSAAEAVDFGLVDLAVLR